MELQHLRCFLVIAEESQEVFATEESVAPPQQAKNRSGKYLCTLHYLAFHGTGAAGAPKLGVKRLGTSFRTSG